MTITPAMLAESVIAVPPLARQADLSIDREANLSIIRYLESGGVKRPVGQVNLPLGAVC